MKRKRVLQFLPLILLMGGCGGVFPPPDPPPPTPPPDPCAGSPVENWPWCHEMDPPGTCGHCKHQPPGEECPIPAPECPEPPPPLPEPQCPTFINRGGFVDVQSGVCDCYLGQVWQPCPEPPPPVGECNLGTPTARSMFAQGKRVQVRPDMHGANISATPQAQFGQEYYCTQEMNWPEACAAGRVFGPVAPDGHPQRMACEAQFLEQPCPTFQMAECKGTPQQCPVSFDPYYVINGVNQNHPNNVAAGCNGDDWVTQPGGGVLRGMFWTASAHGRGTIRACSKDEVVCTTSSFIVDH